MLSLQKRTRGPSPKDGLLQEFLNTVELGVQESIVLKGTELLSAEREGHISLGSQKWLVLETVLQACAAFGLENWANYCFSVLSREFSTSSRVKRLSGLLEESRGNYASALDVYMSLLAENQGDIKTRKRVAMCLLASGRTADAVQCLTRHVAEFGSDEEAWQLLGNLYVSQSCFPQAIFCYEELLLHNANNIVATLSLAELLASTKQYSQGINYFYLILASRGDNLRALWGIVLTVHTALVDPAYGGRLGLKHPEVEGMREDQELCAKQLKRLYQKASATKDQEASCLWNELCGALLDELCRG